MPKLTLSDRARRRLTLAALAGGSPTLLAKEYGVSRHYVWKLREEAKASWEDELEFWQQVGDRVKEQG